MELKTQNIQSHQWEHRILILKTADENNENYRLQMKALKGQERNLIERKLILYKVVGEQYELINFENTEPIERGNVTNDFEKRFFSEHDNFKIILLGLDGGIKLQEHKILSVDKLYSTIDAMPMRRSEMRRKSDN